MAFRYNKKDERKGSREYTDVQYEEVTEDTSSSSSIGKSMRIKGDLTSNEDLIIEGKLKGTLKVSKTLTIGRDGDVNAKIKADIVKILGKATGTIEASNKVSILAGGVFNGNLKSEKLIVQEGALLNGEINQQEDRVGDTKPK
jgi:cytoskeletal protein CcmA (bactofilin family)